MAQKETPAQVFFCEFVQLIAFYRTPLCNCQSRVHPLTTDVPRHIEACQLIFIANQLTGFYMMGKTGR